MDLDPATKPTLTVTETAEALGVSRGSAFSAVHRGEIPSFRIGRRIVVPTAAVRRLLALEDSPGRD